jgi:intracellular sulfur oxidation DsrE/DsrF family protein
MNRSIVAVVSIALALVLSTQISSSAKISVPKISVPLKNSAAASQEQPHQQPHRLVVQVDVNDPAVMNLALNNVSNVAQHYSEIGQKVEIEVVAFGPGLHMLRDDTSPVKARIKSMSETMPQLAFSACGNTRENMTRTETKEIPLVSQAKVVKAGVVRLMELQERGWSYLRP